MTLDTTSTLTTPTADPTRAAGDATRAAAGATTASATADVGVRTYDVRTHGCQMNVHDSERLAGLLETAGLVDLASLPAATRPAVADVVVFNTCAVRENADNKLYGNLGQLRPAKLANPDLQIAVGGCMAQKDRETIVRKAPWVDVVFGTHNIGSCLLYTSDAADE